MPLFEVDASRPLLVQSGRSSGAVEPGLGTTAHRVVDSHIDGLLGEQIFPVAQGVGADEPHLLALDATGSPVVVELVAELDRPALTRALDHAGWAGRLTRGELASRYHGGPNAFQRDVASFYDSVPITRSQPGRSSARLIIICQEAGEEILNAVDFLRQPTMPVEVLKMGVVHSQDGRRFVDVSPLVIHPASAPTAPRLSGAAPAGEARGSTAGDTEPESFAEGVKVGIALTGKHPAVTQPATPSQPAAPSPPAAPARPAAPEPMAPEPAAPEPTPRRTRAGRRAAAGTSSLSLPTVRADVPDGPSAAGSPAQAGSAPRPAAADVPPPPPARPTPPQPAAPAPQPAPATRRRSRTDRFSSQPQQPSPELAAFTAASAGSAEDLDLAELARRTTSSAASTDTPGLGEDFARYTAPALDLPPAPAPRPEPATRRREPAPWDPPESRWEDPLNDPPPYRSSGWEPSTPSSWTNASEDLPRLEVPPLEAPSYTPPPDHGLYESAQPGPLAFDDEVDGDLIALAATLHRPTLLVWSRPRRRQHFEAVLHPDGAIELADGSRYQHPDHAASAASGTPTDDGWNVWHLGPDGPSLLDAYRARFA